MCVLRLIWGSMFCFVCVWGCMFVRMNECLCLSVPSCIFGDLKQPFSKLQPSFEMFLLFCFKLCVEMWFTMATICWPCQTALENTYKYEYIRYIYLFWGTMIKRRKKKRTWDNVSILIEMIGERGLIVIYCVIFSEIIFWFSVIFFVSFL